MADDQELPPGLEKDPASVKVIQLYRSNLPLVLTAADRIVSPFPFDTTDTASQAVFEYLDQDLRSLKERYLTALAKKADGGPARARAGYPLAKRVAASFTGLILLSDLLAGLPHDNDDVPD